MQIRAYLKVVFANGKWRAGVAALGVALAVAVFSACGGSGDTVNTGDGADNGGSASGAPTTTEPVGGVDASRSMSQLPGTLVSGDWQITVSNYTRDGNIVTVPVELTNVGSQPQSPPATEFGNYAIIDDKGSQFSLNGRVALALTEQFLRRINPGVSLPIIPLVFSVPAGASGLNFQFRGGYTSPEVLFRLEGFTSRIVFNSGGRIFTMFSDGSDLRHLPDRAGFYSSLSPDGARIAFVSERNGVWEIYTMSSDGSDVRQLTDNQSEGLSAEDDAGAPSWSPDGSRIAFVSCCDWNDSSEIYTMSLDGLDMRRLTDNQFSDGFPAWSPDGSRVAFVSNRYGGAENYEIYTMSSDGSDVIRLTDNQSEEFGYSIAPSWSPDGSRIAFISDRNGDWEIYTMSSDGSDVRQLTDNPFSGDSFPAWSPDGSRIAFISDRNGGAEIYTMSSDGSDVRQLTDDIVAIFTHISWSPLMPLVDDFGGELVYSGEFDLVVDGRIRILVRGMVVGAPTTGVGWAVRTESGESEIALAQHLASMSDDVKMFCVWWRPDCHTQKELFGAEAWEIVKSRYVECSTNNRQSTTLECLRLSARGIVSGLPTWLIDSSPITNVQNLEDLAAATGYTGPTDFRFIQP